MQVGREYHSAVLCAEVLELASRLSPLSRAIDATLGDGGHARALLAHNPHLALVGIDCDRDMIARARARLREYNGRVTYVRDHYDRDFAHCASAQRDDGDCASGDCGDGDCASAHCGDGEAQFVLFDFGVSMTHIKESRRGFSFSVDEPLDMRFDREQGVTAADIINRASREELQHIFLEYGDEYYAPRIVASICRARSARRIASTKELARIVASALPRKAARRGRNPATKVFQALRIAVNDELSRLCRALPLAFRLLAEGGILVAISFHSGEDRIVKHYIRDCTAEGTGESIYKSVVTPAQDEIKANRAARSAKLRAIRKRTRQ